MSYEVSLREQRGDRCTCLSVDVPEREKRQILVSFMCDFFLTLWDVSFVFLLICGVLEHFLFLFSSSFLSLFFSVSLCRLRLHSNCNALSPHFSSKKKNQKEEEGGEADPEEEEDGEEEAEEEEGNAEEEKVFVFHGSVRSDLEKNAPHFFIVISFPSASHAVEREHFHVLLNCFLFMMPLLFLHSVLSSSSSIRMSLEGDTGTRCSLL